MACFVARPRSWAARTRASERRSGSRAGIRAEGSTAIASVWHRVAGLQHVSTAEVGALEVMAVSDLETAGREPPEERIRPQRLRAPIKLCFGIVRGDRAELWIVAVVRVCGLVAGTIGEGVAPERRPVRLPVDAVENPQLEVGGDLLKDARLAGVRTKVPGVVRRCRGTGEPVPVVAVRQLGPGGGLGKVVAEAHGGGVPHPPTLPHQPTGWVRKHL